MANLLTRVIEWLRAGYPEGVPGPDRVPLLALLRDTPLTEEQIHEVVFKIAEASAPADVADPITPERIDAYIAEVAHYDAGPESVRRVAERLAAAGWPLAGLDDLVDADADADADAEEPTT